MKRLTLLAISLSILAAGSEKPSSFVRFSGLTEEQKKNFTNRFKQSKREVGFKKMGRISPLGKSSKADFNKLQRSSMKTHYRRPPLENEKFLKSNRLYRETNDSRETETILKANEDLYGRWNLESEEEEAIFIKLKSSVTIPNLEQFLGLSLPDGKGINMNDESEEPAPTWALDYMYAADYLRHGFIVLSNFPWFGKGAAIRDGETVYDLVLYYDDRSIEGPDEYFDFITSVNLRHPTAGELYIINEEEFQSISFGRGHSHDGEMAFGGGILSLVFDGAGALTVSDPFDPENPETLEYSVSDDGIVTIEDGPLTVTNSDGSVLAFIEDDEENEEGMMGLGFEVAVGANLASFQGDYYGVLIGQESEEILGEVYEYPLVEVYGINFDGAGNVTSQILSDEDGEVDEGTYTVNENGMLVIGEGEVMGFLSADSAYGVLADTPNEDGEGSDEKMALLLKLGTDKSEASLEGVFRYGSFDVNAEVDGLDYEIDFGFYTGEVEFDGEGNYTDIDPDGENHTGTYEVAEDGKLTFDGQEIGFLGSGDDVILFAAYLEEGLSVEAWTGMAIKKSSGLTESSLSGNYGAAYIELSSDGDQVYVENHVTLDFFGISDSVVTATVVDEGYDEEGELYVDLRFPIPMGISLHNFEIKGYTYEGEELWYSAGGDLEYDRLILPSGVELPLPVLGDQWGDDFEYTSSAGKNIASSFLLLIF